MLLSIPLTIMIKIALENQEETRWIGVLLGSGTALEPVNAGSDRKEVSE